MSDAKYFAKAKQADRCPEGMSVFEWKRLKEAQETEQYLNRGNSYVVRSKEDLAALIDRGEVFVASELADRKQAELEALKAFEAAVEEQERLQKTKISKGGVDTSRWSRESYED